MVHIRFSYSGLSINCYLTALQSIPYLCNQMLKLQNCPLMLNDNNGVYAMLNNALISPSDTEKPKQKYQKQVTSYVQTINHQNSNTSPAHFPFT